MTTFARTDTSVISRWWWTVDRWTLGIVLLMIGIGMVLITAASPAVAERIGLQTFHFAWRQFAFLPVALAIMLATSMLTPKSVRRSAMILFVVFLALTAATLVVGTEIKGARRWLHIAGLSVQPSEFLRPAFAVVSAWLISLGRLDPRVPGGILATLLLALVATLLLKQPDIGMTLMVGGVWGAQLFLAGLPLFVMALLGVLFVSGGVGAYFTFDHVRSRIDHFLDPDSADGYQVERALDAFEAGGLFGRGPGEGRVKEILPDAHSDFILAVAGEEFGLFACLLLVGLFAFVVLRGFARALRDDDLFAVLAAAGLLTQFGLQALVNMASTLHLIPPKGITLPFISYGGSATFALAWAMGMVLALTRDRPAGWSGR
jgi:cell division protein FtsW